MYLCRRDNTIRIKISREVQYYRTGIVIPIKAIETLSTRKKAMMIYFKTGIRIAFCLSLLTLVPVRSMAQDTDGFSPDAPGATTGVGIMPQGKIDWETGFSHEWNRRNGAHERTWTINTSMFRLGLTPQAELRM